MGNAITLSAAEVRDLGRIAGIMIPADPGYSVPAASDPAILSDIINSLGRDLDDVRAVLALLAGHDFGDLDDRQAEALALEHLAQPTRAATALSRAVLQCYYRDERVLRSVGHEPTPPYPRGNTVEQGDWSLLEQVKSLPPLWRDDRGF